MTYPGFIPFTGFDPMDGDDPRFTLSRDNPCRVEPLHHRRQCSASNSKSQQFASLDHGRRNIPSAE